MGLSTLVGELIRRDDHRSHPACWTLLTDCASTSTG